jgi:hypothetical protein
MSTSRKAIITARALSSEKSWAKSSQGGGVIQHADQRLPLRGSEGQPGVRTPVEMQHLAEAGPRLAPHPVPAPRPILAHQPCGLQGLLHEAVGQRHRVLPPGDLMKVPAVEPPVLVPVESQNPLDLFVRRPALRGSAPSPVDKPLDSVPLPTHSPPPQCPWAHLQNVRRLPPAVLATDCPCQDLPNRHRSPPTREPQTPWPPPGRGVSPPSKAVTSLVTNCGHIMNSLQPFLARCC